MGRGSLISQKKPAAIIVASYDTKGPVRADYICDGVNDEVQLQSAITAGAGKKVLILDGTYNKGASAGIIVASNTEIEVLGSINLTKLDASGSIFTNSDQVHGNTGIYIHGNGILNGNRQDSTAGDQFAIDFVNVRGSLVDINIDNFRTLEARLKTCDCVVKNRRFESMSQEEEIIESFAVAGSAADWVWLTPPVSATVEATGQPVGAGYLKIVANKNVNSTLHIKKWFNAGISRDFRYKMLTFCVKIEGVYTAEQLLEMVAMIRWEFDTSDGKVPITYNTFQAVFLSTGWVRIHLLPWNITTLAAKMDKINRVKLVIDTTNTGSNAGPFTVGICDLRLVPLNKFGEGGKACFSLDDKSLSWEDIESKLNEYGYRGGYNVITADTDYNGVTYSDVKTILAKLSAGGADIASHSHTHGVLSTNLWDELIRSKMILQKDGYGFCRAMALPGGNSRWTGDMVAKCFEVYSVVRSTQPAIASNGETVPLFTCVPIILADSIDTIKRRIAWAINNHEFVSLYAHDFDHDLTLARITEVCDWLYDMGIPVVPQSQMFPLRKEPDWRAAMQRNIGITEFSPNGTWYKISVADGGVLSASEIV